MCICVHIGSTYKICAQILARALGQKLPNEYKRARARAQRWQNTCWLGIKRGKKLVSVGSTRFQVNFAANIHVVATDENYRGRVYATSIVSALVQEIFQRSPIALIHVIADNAPAVKAYSSVGFKPYKTYLSERS